MSAYEELVEHIAHMADKHQGGSGWWPRDIQFARDILAYVSRTLENVTPEMQAEAWNGHFDDEAWAAMINASPLAPPKDTPLSA